MTVRPATALRSLRDWGRAHPTAVHRVELLGGVAVLAVIVLRLGAGPFLDGLRAVDASTLLAGTLITAAVTTACAWRWRLVARGLGVELSLGTAVAGYYRSLFLNSVLPGGVLGDVHRGARSGRDTGDVGRGLRAVGWERLAGQLVLLALALVVLSDAPSPVRPALPWVVAGLAAAALVLLARRSRQPRTRGETPAVSNSPDSPVPRRAGWRQTVAADVRSGLLARPVWPGVVGGSVVSTAGQVLTFLVAARAAGVTAPTGTVVPLALLALVAMSVPLNVAGWGPREGVTAWAFGAAGLGTAQGVSAAVVYGVLVFVACLPGAVVLLATRRSPRRSVVPPDARQPVPVGASNSGAADG